MKSETSHRPRCTVNYMAVRPCYLLVIAMVFTATHCLGAARTNTTLTDTNDDFIATYVGPRNADLDILEFSATFDDANDVFIFHATLRGAIGTTHHGVYVIGVNRGNGRALLETIGIPSVLIDSAIVVKNNGEATIANFEPGFTNTSLNGSVTVRDNDFVIRVPATMLPTTGFAMRDYTATLWSRSDGGKDDLIADLAPDDGSAGVSAIEAAPFVQRPVPALKPTGPPRAPQDSIRP